MLVIKNRKTTLHTPLSRKRVYPHYDQFNLFSSELWVFQVSAVFNVEQDYVLLVGK